MAKRSGKASTQPNFGRCDHCGSRTTFSRHGESAFEFDEVCPQHGRQTLVSWAHANQPPAR